VTSTTLASKSEALQATVVIVDDDPQLRGALGSLFRSVGYETAVYESASDLLASELPDGVCCLVMDVRMPGISGFDFHARLVERGDEAPIIFVTGYGDIPMGIRAMKNGAVDFLTKPFREEELLDAVAAAMVRDRERRSRSQELEVIQRRFDSLTPRERQVLGLVNAGLMNKQVAGELRLSEITVKLHRGTMMKKMGLRTLADLVRVAEALRVAKSGEQTG
jgi:FixJ family two-component response regulator